MAPGNDAFALQVTPDLMLKLTKDSQPSKEGVKPKRPAQKAPPRRPRREVPAETRGSGNQDIPKPFYPPFLSSLPGMHESTDHKKDLVPIYKVLEETERMGEKLQKQEEQEIQKVKQLAQELEDKQFRDTRLPSQPIPCQSEKETCLQCYRNNTESPLKCADAVKYFKECSQRVHQNFTQKTAASH